MSRSRVRQHSDPEPYKMPALNLNDGQISVIYDRIRKLEYAVYSSNDGHNRNTTRAPDAKLQETISALTIKLNQLEKTVKSDRANNFDDKTQSIETNNEYREKIMKLTMRVDKLERPVSNRQLSYPSPY